MSGTFYGLKEIKFITLWITTTFSLTRELTIIEIIMNSLGRIWWLRISKDIKSNWSVKARHTRPTVLTSSLLLIIFPVTTVYSSKSSKDVARFGLWSLLEKVKVRVFSCLISYNISHSGRMSWGGSQRVPKPSLTLCKSTSWTLS